MNNNKKTVIVFFLFAIGITSYFAFLILKNHILIQEMGVFQYWNMILTRMSIITPDFYNEGTFLFLGGLYFALILLIGLIIIKKGISSRS